MAVDSTLSGNPASALPWTYETIYRNSEINNQIIPSKLIFGSLLLGLSNYNEYKGFEKKNLKKLKFHGKYSINSDLIFDNKHTDKIFLQQTQTFNTEINDFEIDPDGVQVFNGLKKNVTHTIKTEEGDYYSVLEPILLEIEENNTIYTLLVPAIYVKSLADEKGRENLILILNLGFNLFLMIIGVLTLGTSTAPTALILAILDLGLTTIDTAIILKEKELAKTEEGQQFLKIYNEISLGAAIVSIPLFFKLGMKIIPKVSDTTKKFILKAFLKIIIEKNIINFEANTVKILTQNTEIVLATKAVLNEQRVARLHQLDCFLVSGNTTVNKQTVEEFALIYKGEAIAKGTKNDFQNQIKEIGKNIHNEKRLIEILESMLKGSLRSVLVIGKYSKRTFDINNCGGPILNLSWQNAKITKEGIEIVKKHLSRFEKIPANSKMIKRLEDIELGKIRITDFDKRFYTHEIREYERYKNLGVENSLQKDIAEDIYYDTHAATLEDFKIYELDINRNSVLYHPDIEKVDFYTIEERKILGL